MSQTEKPPKVHPTYGGELIYYKDLPVGSEFYVENGNWEGIIIEEDGVKKVHVYDTGRTFPIPDDYYGWLSAPQIMWNSNSTFITSRKVEDKNKPHIDKINMKTKEQQLIDKYNKLQVEFLNYKQEAIKEKNNNLICYYEAQIDVINNIIENLMT